MATCPGRREALALDRAEGLAVEVDRRDGVL